MATVYIIYSEEIDSFYIGSCENVTKRLEEHKAHTYANSFTNRVSDCKIYLLIDDLSYAQARQIEKHVKRMKSRKYIQNLKQYEEMRLKLVRKYE